MHIQITNFQFRFRFCNFQAFGKVCWRLQEVRAFGFLGVARLLCHRCHKSGIFCRSLTFFAPWIASSEVKLPMQVSVQADTDEVDSGCKLDGGASSPGPEIPRVFLKY